MCIIYTNVKVFVNMKVIFCLLLFSLKVTAKAKWVIVHSAQRSGTTNLFNIFKQHHKLASLYEFFNKGKGQKHTLANSVLSKYEFESRHDFPLERLNSLYDSFHMDGSGRIPVIKIFENHMKSSETKLRELLGHKDSLVIILDRPPMPRKCSLDHALLQNDWAAKHDLHSFNRGLCHTLAISPKEMTFVESHIKWIQKGIEYSKTAYRQVYVDFQSLYFGYNHSNTMQDLLHFIDQETE